MGKTRNVLAAVKANRGKILKRTLIITASVAAVTITANIFRVKLQPADDAVELIDAVSDAILRTAE